MTAKRERFEHVLMHSFSIGDFVVFTREFLTDQVPIAPNKYNKECSNLSYYIAGSTHIANYSGKDGKKIAVFAVELNKKEGVERARSMQRNFAKRLIENGGCDAALIAFYTSGEPKWRLSFVRMDYEFSKGKVNIELTPAKRYSFLVGEGEPCHTAMSRLYPIFEDDGTNPSIDELEEAFSVEKVTEEFFGQYCEKYQQVREWLEKSQDFMDEANYHNFTSEQFAKKLMGQIVFLYFIQKKGWLGVNALPKTLNEKEYKSAFFSRGAKSKELVPSVFIRIGEDEYRLSVPAVEALSDYDEEFLAGCVKGQSWGTGPKKFMRKLFDISEKSGGNYFNDYLEPLFYNALNTNRGENGYFPKFHCRIPFLNGGLFEQLDNYDWEHKNFNLPNTLFSNAEKKGREADGVLDVFDRYNFTMNEDEPMEKEVAIDPEMLGKIFENLLDVKDRKSKGAFYTPREIVHYMCQESLSNYLVNKTGIPYDDIKNFILYGEIMKDEDTVKEVREGYGGMLISSNIFDLKLEINRFNDIDDALANICVADPAVGSGAFPLGMLNEIVRARQNISAYMGISMTTQAKRLMYAFDRHPYVLKSHAIKNCIFAVDIEPSAVDIAKLRLWLSLVIDDEINPTAQNELEGHSKPRALPNLDCNIICGNSLIDEFEGIKLINSSELFGNPNKEKQLYIGQSQYEGLLNQLFEAQNMLFWESSHEGKVDLKARIQSLIDTIIMFNLQNKASPETIEKYHEVKFAASLPFCLWELEFARVFKEKGGFDVVIGNPPYGAAFSEIDKKILKKRFSYSIRGKFESYRIFMELSDYISNPQATLSYVVPNTWMSVEQASNFRSHLLNNYYFTNIIQYPQKLFNATVDTISYVISKTKVMEDTLVFIIPLTEKVDNVSKYLSEPLKINQGVWSNSPKSAIIFGSNFVNRKLIDKILKKSQTIGDIVYTRQGLIPYLTKEDGIKNKYISDYMEDDKWKEYLDGSRCVSRYALKGKISYIKYGDWLYASREKAIFNQPRIIFQLIRNISLKQRIVATYLENELYSDRNTGLILAKDKEVSLKYLLGLLNSKLLNYIHTNTHNSTYISFPSIEALPYRKSDKEKYELIITLVNSILKQKETDNKSNTEEYEKYVDKIVYEIFELTPEEISIIENEG